MVVFSLQPVELIPKLTHLWTKENTSEHIKMFIKLLKRIAFSNVRGFSEMCVLVVVP